MAPAAIGDRPDTELRHQFASHFFLRARWLPIHVGNLIERSYVLFGITVAIETEPHGERLGREDLPHLIDASVTRHAAHAFCDVDRMIEEDEIRQSIDALPVNRLSGEITLSQARELRTLGPYLLMATHAE